MSQIQLYYKDTNSFMSSAGELTYHYTAINNSRIGNPYAECSVVIDMVKGEIVEFNVFSIQMEPIFEPLDISEWNMDYWEVDDLINEYLDINILYNTSTKRSNILMGQNTWLIRIYPDTNSTIVETKIWIDPIKKEIKSIECRDEDGKLKEIDLQKASD